MLIDPFPLAMLKLRLVEQRSGIGGMDVMRERNRMYSELSSRALDNARRMVDTTSGLDKVAWDHLRKKYKTNLYRALYSGY